MKQLLALLAVLLLGCDFGGRDPGPGIDGGATDTDTDGDADTDADTDGDTDTETGTVADGCYDGGFQIDDEEDAQYFWQFPCITGNLVIGSSSLSELSLPNLQEVAGSLLLVDDYDLDELELPVLIVVGEDLDLGDNGLDQLDLGDLAVVGGNLVLGLGNLFDGLELPSLLAVGLTLHVQSGEAETISLPVLTSVGENLFVESDNVESLSAPSLTNVGWVHFCDTGGLTSTNVLANLTSVQGVKIHGTQLTALNGPGGFAALPGGLSLYDNPYLANLEALAGVTSIGGDLELHDNNYLGDLGDLAAVSEIGGDIAIYNNAYLPFCEVCDLLGQLDGFAGELECHDNYDDFCWLNELDCNQPDSGPDASD